MEPSPEEVENKQGEAVNRIVGEKMKEKNWRIDGEKQ